MSVNPFTIIKDSSLWGSSASVAGISRKDPFIRIGIIRSVITDQETSDLRYIVDIQNRNDSISVNARPLYRFGGAFNYEESVGRGYRTDDKQDAVNSFVAKAGDTVLVAFLNGESREGVILGGLTHPARFSTLDPAAGPQYRSEFNGIETEINENGEYTLTFKAVPTNIGALNTIPGARLPIPEYDLEVGTSFLKIDKTGSIEINDNSQQGVQNLRLNKPDGIISINSGNINITMTKSSEQIDIKSKMLNITSDDQINEKTLNYTLNASSSTKIQSPKVAIGTDSIELLDQLSKLIDALAKVTPISPVGPCTPLGTTPQWPEVASIQSKIKEITGSL
jgi:hypothetical protein